MSMRHVCRIGIMALSTLTAPSVLLAEICTFTVECFEDEACQDTNFSVSISDTDLTTDAETIPISKQSFSNVDVFVGYTASAFHVLTRGNQGQARYSAHLFEGMLMVNYLGTCE